MTVLSFRSELSRAFRLPLWAMPSALPWYSRSNSLYDSRRQFPMPEGRFAAYPTTRREFPGQNAYGR
jgi:hypothetical protein